MSTLVTSNISDGTTSVGTSYVVNGSAKAWVNFNGTGTVAIRDSLNVSSLTDIGTGSYTISFANSMLNANYVALVAEQSRGDSTPANLATTSVSFSNWDTSGVSKVDEDICHQAVFGDLA